MGEMHQDLKDYLYLKVDRFQFPVCFECGRSSLFLIYLGKNERAKKYRPIENGTQLFCPRCSPDPSHFKEMYPGECIFREDSILNDSQLLAVLDKFCYNNPYYQTLMTEDRVIITENAKLLCSYKPIIRQALPQSLKLMKMRDLFPAVHRMHNQRFGTIKEMIAAVERKHVEICQSYMNLSEVEASQLQDNFDTLIDRTPMHLKQHAQRQMVQAPQLPQVELERLEQSINDSVQSSLVNFSVSTYSSTSDIHRLDELRNFEDSTSNNSSHTSESFMSKETSREIAMPGGVLSSQDTFQPSSQSVAMSSQEPTASSGLVSSSQSLNVSPVNPVEPSPEPSLNLLEELNLHGTAHAAVTVSNSSDADSSSSTADKPRRRTTSNPASDVESSMNNQTRPAVQPDEQRPGPSGVKKVRYRLGNEIVTNPTPEEFQRNPGVRKPRLGGG